MKRLLAALFGALLGLAGNPGLAQDAAAPTAPAASNLAAAATVTQGRVSYYGRRFAGRDTASGVPFDPQALTMAHRSLPFGTQVRVTNLRNGRSVVVEVNDRGPAVQSRIGDVSLAAARRLGMLRSGVVRARLEVLSAPDAGQ